MTTQTLADQLRDFVDGRRGWKMLDLNQASWGRYFASWHISEGGVPDLVLSIDEARDRPWGGDVTWGSSADSLDSTRGSFDEVTAWLAEWEKVLSLTVRLAECRTRRAAQAMCDRTPRQQISKLAGVLDIKGTDRFQRQELVGQFGPARKGFWG